MWAILIVYEISLLTLISKFAIRVFTWIFIIFSRKMPKPTAYCPLLRNPHERHFVLLKYLVKCSPQITQLHADLQDNLLMTQKWGTQTMNQQKSFTPSSVINELGNLEHVMDALQTQTILIFKKKKKAFRQKTPMLFHRS